MSSCATEQPPLRARRKSYAGLSVLPDNPPDTVDVQEILRQCLKLAAENKISKDNVWELPLINHLSTLVRTWTGQDGENFQKAGSSLDASVKIYSKRVDNVHENLVETLRQCKQAVQEGDDGDENTPAASNRLKRRALSNLDPQSTLAKSQDAINVEQNELAFAADPLFCWFSKNLDVGNVDGLLLSKLQFLGGCDLAFCSDAVSAELIDEYAEQPPQPGFNMSWTAKAIRDGPLRAINEKGILCPSLQQLLTKARGFQDDDDSCAQAFLDELARLKPPTTSVSTGAGSHPTCAARLCASQHGAQVPSDTAACPSPFDGAAAADGDFTSDAFRGDDGAAAVDYGDAGMDYGDDDATAYVDNACSYDDLLGDVEAGIAELALSTSQLESTEHVLTKEELVLAFASGKPQVSGWAGAKYWKAPHAASATTAASKKASAPKSRARAKRLPKSALVIDFLDPATCAPAAKKKSRSTTFSAATLKKHQAQAHKLRLPAIDHHVDASYLMYLNTIPSVTISEFRQSRGCVDSWRSDAMSERSDASNDSCNGGHTYVAGEDYEGGDDYDGTYDGADASASRPADSWGHDDHSLVDTADAGSAPRLQLDMLEAPVTIAKLRAKHSTVTKNVDMIALKDDMWHSVQRGHCSEAPHDPSDAQQQRMPFQAILAGLHGKDLASPQDLSVHLSFICLLHLANEHCLVVEGVPSRDNLFISHHV